MSGDDTKNLKGTIDPQKKLETKISEGIENVTPKDTREEQSVSFKQDEEWKKFKRKTENLEKQISKVETNVGRINHEIRDSNLKTIETLGIFVALFTFVSIEFQIFRSFFSWYAGASLSLIILGALTFFVLLLTTLLNKKKNRNFLYFALFSSICVAGGIFFLSRSTKVDSDYILKTEISKNFYTKEQIDNNIASSTISAKEELDLLKKCVVNFGFTYRCFNQ